MERTPKKKLDMRAKELKDLREELWIILPFFVISLYIFLGSFRYKLYARMVPMIIGAGTALLCGMRLWHIIFPQSKIGQFKEAGLAGEFDTIKEEIEEETLKGHYAEESREITFLDEKKAFIALIGSFLVFLLFGYLVASVFVIVGISYYYGYRNKGQLLISTVSMYIIIYVILYRLLGAPEDFGVLLNPILESLHLIR